jgi:hypothetical protein
MIRSPRALWRHMMNKRLWPSTGARQPLLLASMKSTTASKEADAAEVRSSLAEVAEKEAAN